MAFDVYAIRYASVEVARNNLFPNAPYDGAMAQLDSYFWVIKNDNSAIIVDTGYDKDVAAKRGRSPIFTPQEALDALDIDPAHVRDVILTHLHYDHAGNVDLFPEAVFHVQATELAHCTGAAMLDNEASAYFAVEDITKVMHLLYQGQLNILSGATEICAGVSVMPLPGHTPGLQAVRVETRDGPVVIAGDAVHFYDLLNDNLPFPVASDPQELVRSYAKLADFASDTYAVLAGHDPKVRSLFPERGPHPEITRVTQPTESAVPWTLSPLGDQK